MSGKSLDKPPNGPATPGASGSDDVPWPIWLGDLKSVASTDSERGDVK